jgi:hypothetical protein
MRDGDREDRRFAMMWAEERRADLMHNLYHAGKLLDQL